MSKRHTWILILLCAWLNCQGAASILRDDVFRSSFADWSSLGTPDFPFHALYVNSIFLKGQNLTSGGGGTNAPVAFTNTVTLSPGSSATCTAYGGVAGYWVLGLPAGAPGTNGINILSNSVLSSKQITLLSSNAFVFNGSNYLGSFSQLQDYDLNPPTLGPGGATPNTNLLENLYGSTNGGSAWFIITNSPVNITNPILLSVSGDSNSAPGSLYLYGVDHPELMGRTNSFFGQYFQFDDPVRPQDAVTLNYLQQFAPSALAPVVTLPNGWTMASTNIANTNYLSFQGYGLPALTMASVPNFIPIIGVAMARTNVVLNIYATNFVNGAFIETTLSIAPVITWTLTTNYTTVTNSGIISFTNPVNFATQPIGFFRARGNFKTWLVQPGNDTPASISPTLSGYFTNTLTTPLFVQLSSGFSYTVWKNGVVIHSSLVGSVATRLAPGSFIQWSGTSGTPNILTNATF